MKNILFIGQRNVFDDFLTADYAYLNTFIKEVYSGIVYKRFYEQREKLLNSGLNFITTSDYSQARNILEAGFLNMIIFYKLIDFDKRFLLSPDKEKRIKVYNPEIRASSVEKEIPEMYKVMEQTEKYTPILIFGPNMGSKTHGWNIHKSILEESLVNKIMKVENSNWLKKSNKKEISVMIHYIQELLVA